jgi:glycosidase
MQERIINFETPKRFKGRTGLQIFVDRFYRNGAPPEPMEGRVLKEWSDTTPNWEPDSNGVYQNDYFYGGNLQGIIAKLGYIRANGFNIIYLSPLGLSETSHHYEPIDQLQIDPWIGTWDDFQELCKEAHKRDILIVVDLVFNHMGVKSPIFQDALYNPNSKYRNWFEWDHNGRPVFWAGFDNMPQCNKYNPEYQDYTVKVATHYINMGADGIRLDLGENFPPEFMRNFRKAIKAVNSEVLIVNEAWGFDNHRDVPQLDGTQEDSDMNYPLADAIIRWVRYGNAAHFRYNVGEILKYPKEAQDVMFNHIDTHDTPRAINLLVGDGILQDPYKGACWDIEGPWRHHGWFDTYGFRKWEYENDHLDMDKAFESLCRAVIIQYFMPGIPIVFAGTEVGVTGYKDPFNRKPYPWDNPNQKILEYYRRLGRLRERNREFFSEAGDVQINVSHDELEIIRTNSYGVRKLRLSRKVLNGN